MKKCYRNNNAIKIILGNISTDLSASTLQAFKITT